MSIEEIASALASANRRGAQIRTGAPLEDAAQAYEVQQRVWARVQEGRRPVAWKVGAPDDRTKPTGSPILATHASGAALSGRSLHRIGIEAEVAYRLGRDLPARDRAYADEEIAAAVMEVVVAIEICDTRLADWGTAPDLWKLADFQNNAALVVGSGTTQWRAIDFTAQRAELLVDGTPLVDLAGGHPFGNPFRLMPWIVAHCGRWWGGLKAGDAITTGSWGGVHYVEPECEVRARFAGIGEAAATILG